jgi:NAD(P)-dependent dehydrogenase (short-subunit alcohol dehydrogenase family)
MTLDLTEKTALVTGAGSGLGRHVAIGLARCGARLALVGRQEGPLVETARAICDSGGAAVALPCDVSRIEAVENLKARVEQELGPPQILINAAGVFGPIQMVGASDPKRWIETLMINTVGPYLTCRAFVGGMIEHGWGRIINFSSAASLHPPGPLNSAYGTSKVALNQFTRHLAAELAGTPVTANVIHPGEVKTEMWAAIRDESLSAGAAGESHRDWAAFVAKTGGDDPQKALELILELLDEKSAHIHGRFLWIKGGLQTPLASW